MADWTVDIKDLAGGAVASDVPVESLDQSDNLNSAGAVTFTLPLYSTAATQANLAPVKRTIELRRDATLRFAGPIWMVGANLSDQQVNVSAEGWYSLLRRRQLTDTVVYTAQEQLDIAWDLIDRTQSATYGNIGITRWGSETPSGINRKRLWCCYERMTISDAIEDIAFADDGFDFDITPAKVWRAWSPRRGTSKNVTFATGTGPDQTLPADTYPIYQLSFDEDGQNLTTEASVIPDDDNCNDIVVLQSSNIATYNLLQNEVTSGEKVRDRADRVTLAREYIRSWRVPRYTVSLDTDLVPWSNYDVGDMVTVDADAGFATFDREFRVISWRVQVASGVETVQLELDSIIDSTV